MSIYKKERFEDQERMENKIFQNKFFQYDKDREDLGRPRE
jgi:hypothetical protein